MGILRKISLWVRERLEPKDPLEREINRLESAIAKAHLRMIDSMDYETYNRQSSKLDRQELWLGVLYDRRNSRKSRDKI